MRLPPLAALRRDREQFLSLFTEALLSIYTYKKVEEAVEHFKNVLLLIQTYPIT
jgi:hypothetical protein